MFYYKNILLDSACTGIHLQTAIEYNSCYDSLYRGTSQQTLATVAPYLFTFPQNTEFSNWYLETGWGNAWGILFSTTASFEECHKHFRKFLLVKTEAGKELYFRFYDPRVLRVFLPSCNQQQIIEFFGPVDHFITEGENKEQAIVSSQENGILKQEELPAAALFNQHIAIL